MNATTKILAVFHRSTRNIISSLALALLAGGAMLNPAISQAAGTWTGLGTNGNWSTTGNWSPVPTFPTALTFAGSTQLTNTNDNTGITVSGITFDAAAGAFVLNGNAITLSSDIAFSANPSAPVTQTINLSMAQSSARNITTQPNGNLTLGGAYTGAYQLTTAGAGTVTMGGVNSIAGLIVNGGTNIITGNTTVNGTGSTTLYLGNGSSSFFGNLVIQPGATFNITGSFGDSFVVGRNGGSGTVIQNGGTFTFNPSNNKTLLFAATGTGQTTTRAEYDMNGGLLNMSGNTLSVGWGNSFVTGLVNQVSGVITNVNNLLIPNQSGQNGLGVYNLSGGSLYIGAGSITTAGGSSRYAINLGGGTVGAYAAWSSSLNMTLTGSNGPVTFNPAAFNITLSGALTGPGGLIKTGSATLILASAADDYRGDTTVTAGILQFNNVFVAGLPGALRLTNGAVLNLNFTGTTMVGGFYTNGVALPAGVYTSSLPGGFITGGGALNVTAVSSGLWTGSGADNNWSTAGNWNSNAVPSFPIGLTFAGTTRLTNNNDLTSVMASSLTFDAAAGAFVLGGNGITNGSGGIAFNGNPAAPITQTVNLNLALSASQNFDIPANGNLTVGGNITTTNELYKVDAGTLTLGGSNTLEGFSVNGGTNVITGNTTLIGTNWAGNYDRVYVGDGDTMGSCMGTLVIQTGAVFSVTGSFGDAFVVGRDGGSGKVVQNGGTFTFNPANQTLFLLGASSAANMSEYDMNGGLLNMSGKQLGVGYGNGASSTDTLNQASGVITNVLKLSLPASGTSAGLSVYNLSGGSIYIGGNGITTSGGSSRYVINLGGGTVGSYATWSSSLNMNLTNLNGSVTFNPGGYTNTLSGALTGNGGLTLAGSGRVVLSSVGNSYTGDTTVSGGTLQLNQTGSSLGAFHLASGTVLNLNFSGNYAVAGAYTNGVILSVGTYNSTNLPAFITGTGNLVVAGSISTGIWTGGGADNNWSTAGNWNNGAEPIFPIGLTFAGSTRLTNTNNLTGVTASGLTFDVAAGAFVLNGNGLTNSSGIAFNGNPAAPITQTVNLNMALSASQNFDIPANGNLTVGGNITSSNDLYKVDAGTLTLGGSNTMESLGVDGGTNIITGNTTLNGTTAGGNYDRCYVGEGEHVANCFGTLVIQPGAVFTVTGSFNDSFVIGRDNGSGRVIQNGGIFTYNPANQTRLLLGASAAANTAEYDMNGGLLNLSGNQLGVGWGNGASSTDTLNQASGVITNVLNLALPAFYTSAGLSVYTLSGGGIYIGTNGITTAGGSSRYAINLGGGTVGAYANWASSLNLNLTNLNGSVTFDTGAGNTITLSGALSGNGGLSVIGSGILDLTNSANSYAGDTIVNTGTLQLDVAGYSPGAGAFRITNGALFNLTYSGTYGVHACYTNGVSLPVGVYTAANLPGFITGSGSLTVASSFSTGIWTGGGVDNNWSTAGNWDQNAVPIFPIGLTFVGPGGLTNNNNLSSITASSLTFDAAAGAFVLGGNGITLSGNIGFNGNPFAPVTQTVNLNQSLTGNRTFDTPANGNLSLGGNLTSANDVYKIDAGTLTLGGLNAIEDLDVNGGTTIITGNTTVTGVAGGGNYDRIYVGDGDSIANCTGTLVIQPGATLTVQVSFADALVIGRDSGSGTVIQNGGTFTYNPGNQTRMLVGATIRAGTTAAYNMNGGLLDMSGNTLGVGYADGGVVYTGFVNQAGGLINNVYNLDLGANQSGGTGVYTLSGGSINIGGNGITTVGGNYAINLGGGTVGAYFGWSSSLNMNLTNLNGSVTFAPAGNTITLSGTLSGNGGLTNSGSGTLILSGTNTYTGNTTVSGGTLEVVLPVIATNSTVTVASGAVIQLDFAVTNTVAGLVLNGASQAPGVYNSTTGSPYITGTGSLQVTSVVAPLSTNAYLMSLVFSPSAGFAPSFTTNGYLYYETNAYLSTPTVTVTNADPTATNTLIVNGVSLGILTNEVASVPLTLGIGSTNVVQVQVVSQDLSVTNLYVVDVTLQGPPLGTNAFLTSLALNPPAGTLPGFATNVYSYSVTNAYTNSLVQVTASSEDTNATMTLTFNNVLAGSLTNGVAGTNQTLQLNPPTNTVAVRVISQDLSQTNVYTVNVLLQPSQTVPKLTNSVSAGALVLSWPADHLGYRLLVQTNNLNKGVSSSTNDWMTVPGSTVITTTNITIIKTGVTNEYYRLVYP